MSRMQNNIPKSNSNLDLSKNEREKEFEIGKSDNVKEEVKKDGESGKDTLAFAKKDKLPRTPPNEDS